MTLPIVETLDFILEQAGSLVHVRWWIRGVIFGGSICRIQRTRRGAALPINPRQQLDLLLDLIQSRMALA